MDVTFLKKGNDSFACTTSVDSLIKIWNIPTNFESNRPSCLVSSLIGHSDSVWKVIQINGEKPLIASCSSDGFIKIWDFLKSELVSSYQFNEIPITIANFDEYLYIGFNDGSIRTIDLSTEEHNEIFKGKHKFLF